MCDNYKNTDYLSESFLLEFNLIETSMEYDTLSRNATFPARCNKEYYPRLDEGVAIVSQSSRATQFS